MIAAEVLSARIRERAVSEGMRIAEKFFAKRKSPSEVHVSLVEFSGMLAIAYELGMEEGMECTKL